MRKSFISLLIFSTLLSNSDIKKITGRWYSFIKLLKFSLALLIKQTCNNSIINNHVKKSLFILTVTTFLVSCNSNNVKINGDFVKVENKNKEYNVYTFNYNNTLRINKNGDNYLITDAKGNKSIGTYEKGILKLQNNCSILFDETEKVLTKTCLNNSSDYWPKEKVEKYLLDMKNIKYREYMTSKLSKITEILSIPTPDIEGKTYIIYDSEGNKKNEVPIDIFEKNPFFPFMTFGDFNNDNIFPDIATVAFLENGGDIPPSFYEKFYRRNYGHDAIKTLFILHAGSNKVIKIYNRDMYPFIVDYTTLSSNNSISFDDVRDNKSILIRNHKDKYDNDYEVKWNGRKYVVRPINLH